MTAERRYRRVGRLGQRMVLVAAEVAVLVSETALHPRIGGPTVMRAQLEHLARLATRAKAKVGIVLLD